MGDERVKNEAMEIMGLVQLLPRLVVFDLDYTLWPFYCECRSKREMPKLYPHAKGILCALKDKGVDVAIASRSPTPDIANTFLEKLGIKSMFVAQEIFSSWTHKTDHFQRINRRTQIPYNEMLFFDDEDRNIDAVRSLPYHGDPIISPKARVGSGQVYKQYLQLDGDPNIPFGEACDKRSGQSRDPRAFRCKKGLLPALIDDTNCFSI
ncbi:UNVERIFIED_CONTAM: Magnesium-dependent phosphatase 1 [Sesamum latifolium]|uniref:Magnesium-dependent phosphatase 1 n=1 Tax=Sesamum latifolium TaxID=2727402 RepID=A0AAW2UZG1_9LAMI